MHFFVANFSTACYTFPVMEVILNTEIEILGVTVNVFNQVFSLIATVLMIACYYVSRKKYMWLLSIALLVCVIEYLILKQYSVCISYSVSIARNVVQIIYDNKNKKMPFWITAIFVAAVLGIGLPTVTAEKWYGVLPLIGTAGFMLANHLNSYFLFKGACGIKQFLSIGFNVFAGDYIGIIREIIVLCAIIGGMIKTYGENRKKAQSADGQKERDEENFE